MLWGKRDDGVGRNGSCFLGMGYKHGQSTVGWLELSKVTKSLGSSEGFSLSFIFGRFSRALWFHLCSVRGLQQHTPGFALAGTERKRTSGQVYMRASPGGG